MTRVNFYILGSTRPQGREKLACRLADKARNLGHRVYIHTDSARDSSQIDRLLWTFRDDSFLPHAICDDSGDNSVPVLIGHGEDSFDEHDVLINLASDIPLFFSNFNRVTELVEQTPDCLERCRKHYRFYQDRGYELETHKL